jgi:urea transport system substrate-binding protein
VWDRQTLRLGLALALLVLSACQSTREPAPIRLGVLHSLTGARADRETPVKDAVVMAVEEINRAGGLLGRKLETVLADGASDAPTFAREAERLIRQEKVSTLVGCWTSEDRQSVLPVLEKNRHLLLYPAQSEGLEQSSYVVYTGPAPNQQILPAVTWSFTHLGPRFFLLGSNSIFSRTAQAIMRDQARELGAQVVGEGLWTEGNPNESELVKAIRDSQPDLILCSLPPQETRACLKAFSAAGIGSDKIPTMSLSITEQDLVGQGAQDLVGNYACWSYFQSIDEFPNKRFVQGYQKRFGARRVTDDAIEAAYFGVKLWAQAVREAGSDEVKSIRQAISHQSLRAPEGVVSVDPSTQYTWKKVRIGKVLPHGQFDICWESDRAVRPIPFPPSRSRTDWERCLRQLGERP